MFKYFLIAACVATTLAADVNIPFEWCSDPNVNGGYLPGPTSLQVPECLSLPCALEIGQNVTVKIGVYVDAPVTSLPTYVSVGTEDYAFGMDPFDACLFIGDGVCPDARGFYDIVLHFTLDTEGLVAGKLTTVYARITDQDEVPVACGAVSTTFLEQSVDFE